MEMIRSWIQNHSIEFTGTVLVFIFMYLEVNKKWTMWIMGIISSLFYVYITYKGKIYAQTGLNIYNVILSAYGLYCWKFAKGKGKKEVEFNNITGKKAFRTLSAGITGYLLIFFLLYEFTDSKFPMPILLDTFVADLSILATYLAAKKVVESWYLWMIVNISSILLYLSRELYSSTLLYVVYSILSVYGYYQWKKSVPDKKNKYDTTDQRT